MMFNLENTTSKIHWTKKISPSLRTSVIFIVHLILYLVPQPPLLNNSNVEPAQLAQVEMARK